MPNYKETTISGTQYQRARMISIDNELNRQPTITFVEERISILPDSVIHADCGQLVTYFDSAGSIALVNPETDEPTGTTISHGELYAILYSLYKQAAAARDLAE